MKKRFAALLAAMMMLIIVLVGCRSTPVPYHFSVCGHQAVLSTNFIGNADEEIDLSIDGCISSSPVFVKTPLFGRASFQIQYASCPEGYVTIAGAVDSSGNFSNVKVILP